MTDRQSDTRRTRLGARLRPPGLSHSTSCPECSVPTDSPALGQPLTTLQPGPHLPDTCWGTRLSHDWQWRPENTRRRGRRQRWPRSRTPSCALPGSSRLQPLSVSAPPERLRTSWESPESPLRASPTPAPCATPAPNTCAGLSPRLLDHPLQFTRHSRRGWAA